MYCNTIIMKGILKLGAENKLELWVSRLMLFLYIRLCFYVSHFLCIRFLMYCYGNGNGVSREFNKNAILNPRSQSWIIGKSDIKFFSHFFLVPQKGYVETVWSSEKLLEVQQRRNKIKIYVIFHFNYFKMLGIEKVNKVFCPGIFINI